MNNFIMVTPAKNEETFLPKVIESIASSTLTPNLWIIVDDNSSDKTPHILRDNAQLYDFIEVLTLTEEHPRDLAFHYSYVCRMGFNYVTRLAQERGIDWDYIVLLDADTIVDSDYFENVLNEMNNNYKIGISSGDVYSLKNEKKIRVKSFGDIPSGTARVWRKKCFYDSQGYLITYAPDSVSRVKARIKGWDTVRFEKYRAYQLRDTSSANGLWRGSVVTGESAYYLNKHPFLILLLFISYSIKRPFYTGIPFIYGYLMSLFKRNDQIDDTEVKDYYWNKRLKEIVHKQK
jgi:glycosyltransferase involved in cell wall biosynthesis